MSSRFYGYCNHWCEYMIFWNSDRMRINTKWILIEDSRFKILHVAIYIFNCSISMIRFFVFFPLPSHLLNTGHGIKARTHTHWQLHISQWGNHWNTINHSASRLIDPGPWWLLHWELCNFSMGMDYCYIISTIWAEIAIKVRVHSSHRKHDSIFTIIQ